MKKVTRRYSSDVIFEYEGDLKTAVVDWLKNNESDLSYSNLRGSNLSYSNLSYSDLIGSNLRGSNLSYSNLSYSNLSGSDLIGSNLSGSNLIGSNLRGSNLIGSNLSGSNLSGSNLSGSYNADNSGRIASMQHGKYRLVMLDKEILWGGCTKKTCQEWLDYDGKGLNDYDKNYLETITKPFVRMMLGK